VLGADLETQLLAAFDLDLLAARLDAERDADYGDPALAVLVHGQHRFALITHLRRLRRIAQVDHRYTAGHRLVQQAGDETIGMGRQSEQQGQQAGEHFCAGCAVHRLSIQ